MAKRMPCSANFSMKIQTEILLSVKVTHYNFLCCVKPLYFKEFSYSKINSIEYM